LTLSDAGAQKPVSGWRFTMLRVSRVRRGPVSFAGAAVLLTGVLGLLSGGGPIEASQAAAAQTTSARMSNGSEFPTWERPLQFTKTYYVNGSAANASDSGPGTQQQPFKTISRAADVLQPGERVVIASGIYREVIRPKRGGTGPDQMISYEAADGANVVVRGSEVVREGWHPSGAGRGAAAGGGRGQGRAGGAAGPAGGRGGAQAPTWDVDLDGSWFNGYNPFGSMNMPQQRWQYMNRMSINVHNILVPYTRVRGMLFVDGKPLDQVRVTSELFGRDPSWAIGSRGQPYSAEFRRDRRWIRLLRAGHGQTDHREQPRRQHHARGRALPHRGNPDHQRPRRPVARE